MEHFFKVLLNLNARRAQSFAGQCFLDYLKVFGYVELHGAAVSSELSECQSVSQWLSKAGFLLKFPFRFIKETCRRGSVNQRFGDSWQVHQGNQSLYLKSAWPSHQWRAGALWCGLSQHSNTRRPSGNCYAHAGSGWLFVPRSFTLAQTCFQRQGPFEALLWAKPFERTQPQLLWDKCSCLYKVKWKLPFGCVAGHPPWLSVHRI